MSSSVGRRAPGGWPAQCPPVTVTRSARGWSVISPSGASHAADLLEGLTLADLVADECGALAEPDRTARRSARGPGPAGDQVEDGPAGRIAALERTVAQLEHALAARVSTERAIGVLAERNRTGPRAAFESLRREARSTGRPVAELAREVLAGLEELAATGARVDAGPLRMAPAGRAAPPSPRPASTSDRGTAVAPPGVAAADGRS